jgi:hypothetical protein
VAVTCTGDLVRRHVEGFWPGHEQREFEWTAGPIGALLPDFRVRRIAPKTKADLWVYTTIGAWQATEGNQSNGRPAPGWVDLGWGICSAVRLGHAEYCGLSFPLA